MPTHNLSSPLTTNPDSFPSSSSTSLSSRSSSLYLIPSNSLSLLNSHTNMLTDSDNESSSSSSSSSPVVPFSSDVSYSDYSSSFSSDPQLTDSHRMLAALLGSLLTSLIVTPFDVVKTRLQSQIRSSTSSLLDSCSHYRLHTGLIDVWCHKCAPAAAAPDKLIKAQSTASSVHFTSSFDAFIKLVRNEGFPALWRGLGPTLVHSLPSTVLYFWGYDHLKFFINHSSKQNQTIHKVLLDYSPILAGTSARALSTIIVSPIELIKTKSQSFTRSVPALTIARQEFSKGGPLSLWRGVSATLWRDVPFSAIYWYSYEYFKRKFIKSNAIKQLNNPDGALLWTSFVSGASGGMIAAFLTHPFDIVKTRRQIEMFNFHQPSSPSAARPSAPSTVAVFSQIFRDEGWRGFTSGLAPRVTKIAPACAIMISTYEIAKAKFGKLRNSK
jgi:solute carrier family 25 protein 39/40